MQAHPKPLGLPNNGLLGVTLLNRNKTNAFTFVERMSSLAGCYIPVLGESILLLTKRIILTFSYVEINQITKSAIIMKDICISASPSSILSHLSVYVCVCVFFLIK